MIDQHLEPQKRLPAREDGSVRIQMDFGLISVIRLRPGFDQGQRDPGQVLSAKRARKDEPANHLGVGVDLDQGRSQRGMLVTGFQLGENPVNVGSAFDY